MGAYAWFKNPKTGGIGGSKYYPDLINTGVVGLPVFKKQKWGMPKPSISEEGIPSHIVKIPKRIQRSWRGNNMGGRRGIKKIATSVSKVKQPRVRNRYIVAAKNKYDFLIKKNATTKTKLVDLRAKRKELRRSIKSYEQMLKKTPSKGGLQRKQSYYRSKQLSEKRLNSTEQAIIRAQRNLKEINSQTTRVTRRLKYLTGRNNFGGIRSGIKRGIKGGY